MGVKVKAAGRKNRALSARKSTTRPLKLVPGREFASNSYIHTPLRSDAPLLPDSAALVTDFMRMKTQYFGYCSLNINSYSPSIWLATGSEARMQVYGDANSDSFGTTPYIEAKMTDVPVIPGFGPSPGTDSETVIYCPNTGEMWEFWVLHFNELGDGKWRCSQGGKIIADKTELASHSGRFFNDGHANYSTQATGIPFLGTVITIDDIESGSIDHPLQFAIPEAAGFPKILWPATRTDGYDGIATFTKLPPIREGTCFRFPTSINFDASPYDTLTRFQRMIAKAIQKYGVYITDRSGSISMRSQNPLGIAVDPYFTPGGYMGCGADPNAWECSPQMNMEVFPWSSMVAVDPTAGQSLAGGPTQSIIYPVITSIDNPASAVSTALSHSLTSTDGTGTKTWSIVTGYGYDDAIFSITGSTLSAAGQTTQRTYKTIVQVVDSLGNTTAQLIKWKVGSAITSISTASTAGWTAYGHNGSAYVADATRISSVSGALRITSAAASSFPIVQQQLTGLTVGATVRLYATMSNLTGGLSAIFQAGRYPASTFDPYAETVPTNGVNTIDMTVDATGSFYFTFCLNTGGTGSVDFSAVGYEVL